MPRNYTYFSHSACFRRQWKKKSSACPTFAQSSRIVSYNLQLTKRLFSETRSQNDHPDMVRHFESLPTAFRYLRLYFYKLQLREIFLYLGDSFHRIRITRRLVRYLFWRRRLPLGKMHRFTSTFRPCTFWNSPNFIIVRWRRIEVSDFSIWSKSYVTDAQNFHWSFVSVERCVLRWNRNKMSLVVTVVCHFSFFIFHPVR